MPRWAWSVIVVVLGLLGLVFYAGFLWTRVVNEVDTKASFQGLVLVDLPEMAEGARADLNLSPGLAREITALRVGGWSRALSLEHRLPGLAFARLASAAGCSSLDLVPGVKIDKDASSPNGQIRIPNLAIVPHGQPGCAVEILTDETMAGLEPIPALHLGEQLIVTFEPGTVERRGSAASLFENVTVGSLSGHLSDPIALLDSGAAGTCPGLYLEKLAAQRIELGSIRLDSSGATPVLEATLHLQGLTELTTDRRDCRWVIFRRQVRAALLTQAAAALVSGVFGFLLGMILVWRRPPC